MLDLLKYTYIFDIPKIKESIERLWDRYQGILDNKNSTKEDLYEARAILYCLGRFYSEEFALGAIKRRIQYIKPEIGFDKFLKMVDSGEKYDGYNKIFNDLSEFYLIVKGIKNREKNGSYLDEERFNIIAKEKGVISSHPLD
ncbi:MAG: hypothetical protein U9P50_03260 [Patescibacteria group bacterium]|nr:hypothetical protein [Patescibacteria group bacterium]